MATSSTPNVRRPGFPSVFSVLQSASSVTHLPFVSSSRLGLFLAQWDDGLGSPEHAFLHEYFETQEEVFHALLDLISQVSVHLNYWLDWTVPVRRWPILLRSSVRHIQSLHLSALGRKKQVMSPSETASNLKRMHGELCRLVAFIQISTLELLAYDLDTEEQREQALDQVAQNLDCQARAARRLVEAVRQREAGCIQNPQGVDEEGCRTPEEHESEESKSALMSIRPERTSSSSFDKFDTAVSQCLSYLPWRPTHESHTPSPLVSTGMKRLEGSRLAMQSLIRRLKVHMRDTGRPGHMEMWWPLYAFGAAVGLHKAKHLLFDSRQRTFFFNHLREVGQQFVREWVSEPMVHFISELFRRLGTNDMKRLSLELEELRTEQQSLDRMLNEFVSAVRQDASSTAPVCNEAAAGNLKQDFADRYFENSMQNPMSNLFHGHLMESCMVQSQRMKVLLYASLYSIDAVLLQLKWDFLMAGIVPFMSLCGIGCWIVTRRSTQRFLRNRRNMLRALAEIDRYYNYHSRALTRKHGSGCGSLNNLLSYAGAQEKIIEAAALRQLLLASDRTGALKRSGHSGQFLGRVPDLPPLSPYGHTQVSELESADAQVLELEKVGAALGHLDALCRIASQIRLEDVDWRSLRKDILDLASPELTVSQKLHIIGSMRSTYFIIWNHT